MDCAEGEPPSASRGRVAFYLWHPHCRSRTRAFYAVQAAPQTSAAGNKADSSSPPQPQATPRRPPQAKTQKEYSAYNAAYALSGGAAVEKAADNFAAQYPDSELRGDLYSKTMLG